MRDLTVRVMEDLPVPHDKPRGMRGNLMATTPLRNFQLRITAERTADVASPGEATILERAIQ